MKIGTIIRWTGTVVFGAVGVVAGFYLEEPRFSPDAFFFGRWPSWIAVIVAVIGAMISVALMVAGTLLERSK